MRRTSRAGRIHFTYFSHLEVHSVSRFLNTRESQGPNALDVAAAAQGAGAFPNSGSVTTTMNGDLLLGGIMTTGEQFYTAGAGYTIEQSVPTLPNTKVIAEDQLQPTAGTTSATASLGVADFWAAVVATFKPAASGGSSTSTERFGKLAFHRSRPTGGKHAGAQLWEREYRQQQLADSYPVGFRHRQCGHLER